jgi:hypothetical protein
MGSGGAHSNTPTNRCPVAHAAEHTTVDSVVLQKRFGCHSLLESGFFCRKDNAEEQVS